MCLGGAYDFCCEQAKQEAIRRRNEFIEQGNSREIKVWFICCGNKFEIGEDGRCKPVIEKIDWARKNWRECSALNFVHRGTVTSFAKRGYGGQF